MIDGVTVWVGLAVSALAVVVSAVAAYIGLRQSRSARVQAEVARETLTVAKSHQHAQGTPELMVHISDLAANAYLQSVPSALMVLNRSSRDLHAVTVEFQPQPFGISGFRQSGSVVPRASVPMLGAYAQVSIPLVVEGSGPSSIQTTVRVTAGSGDGPPWSIAVPCYWHRFVVAGQPQGQLGAPPSWGPPPARRSRLWIGVAVGALLALGAVAALLWLI